MNEIHSSSELIYHPRWLGSVLRAALGDHPVVVFTGPRQTGTLLQHEEPFSRWRYITLDDFDALRQAERDPSALWAGVDKIVLDEVQKSPALLSAVKRSVDQKRSAVSFVLSGSANLLLMGQVSESLSGRAVYFTLYPMTLGEMEGNSAPDLLAKFSQRDAIPEGAVPITPRYQDAENLRVFLEEYPETEAALLVHSGAEVKRLHEKILAVPWVLLSRQSS